MAAEEGEASPPCGVSPGSESHFERGGEAQCRVEDASPQPVYGRSRQQEGSIPASSAAPERVSSADVQPGVFKGQRPSRKRAPGFGSIVIIVIICSAVERIAIDTANLLGAQRALQKHIVFREHK